MLSVTLYVEDNLCNCHSISSPMRNVWFISFSPNRYVTSLSGVRDGNTTVCEEDMARDPKPAFPVSEQHGPHVTCDIPTTVQDSCRKLLFLSKVDLVFICYSESSNQKL